MTRLAGAVAAAVLATRVVFAAPELTPVGADAAANTDGSIPAWTGGLRADEWPAAYEQGGPLLDPYAADNPLFVITATNYREYADHLTPGQAALFAKYPDFSMPVYRTRRSVAFPAAIYEATHENVTRARLKGADAISGARAGIPFPQPRSGVEVLWNHRLRYHGDSMQWRYQRAYVEPSGDIEMSNAVERVLYAYADPESASDHRGTLSYRATYLQPCESVYRDVVYLWHEPLNVTLSARRLWAYAPGNAHAYRNPPLGYDEVGYCSHLVRYFDMVDMFSGAFDRYTFKLLGKRELYVPYNSFRLNGRRSPSPALLARGHLNQSEARYELHRVWGVEATLRPGETHSISKRLFYVEEDSWSILLVDCYDRDGRLWRVQEGHLLPLYPAQGVDYAPTVTYDLKDGRYFADRLLSDREGWAPITAKRRDFTPQAVGTWRPGK